jgi:hypothetical protein
MQIKIYSLIEVSRHCQLTEELYQLLNDKLTDEEKFKFNQWLKIVNEEKLIDKQKTKRNF